MPIYEYVCKNCKHTFEIWQGFQEDPLDKCLQCQLSNVRRKIPKVGVILKGSGWTTTERKPEEKFAKKED